MINDVTMTPILMLPSVESPLPSITFFRYPPQQILNDVIHECWNVGMYEMLEMMINPTLYPHGYMGQGQCGYTKSRIVCLDFHLIIKKSN